MTGRSAASSQSQKAIEPKSLLSVMEPLWIGAIDTDYQWKRPLPLVL